MGPELPVPPAGSPSRDGAVARHTCQPRSDTSGVSPGVTQAFVRSEPRLPNRCSLFVPAVSTLCSIQEAGQATGGEPDRTEQSHPGKARRAAAHVPARSDHHQTGARFLYRRYRLFVRFRRLLQGRGRGTRPRSRVITRRAAAHVSARRDTGGVRSRSGTRVSPGVTQAFVEVSPITKQVLAFYTGGIDSLFDSGGRRRGRPHGRVIPVKLAVGELVFAFRASCRAVAGTVRRPSP